MVPHDNDPVVISVVTAGRKVHRVLVDQGSSANVMFLSTFNKLRLSPDLLRPYTILVKYNETYQNTILTHEIVFQRYHKCFNQLIDLRL